MVELLCGMGFKNALDWLGLVGDMKYTNGDIEVWSVDEECFKRLENYNGEWKKDWGYYRYAKPAGQDELNDLVHTSELIRINGKDIMVYEGTGEGDEQDQINLLRYINARLGATIISNVCCISRVLSQMNGLTIAELFQKYQG